MLAYIDQICRLIVIILCRFIFKSIIEYNNVQWQRYIRYVYFFTIYNFIKNLILYTFDINLLSQWKRWVYMITIQPSTYNKTNVSFTEKLKLSIGFLSFIPQLQERLVTWKGFKCCNWITLSKNLIDDNTSLFTVI